MDNQVSSASRDDDQPAEATGHVAIQIADNLPRLPHHLKLDDQGRIIPPTEAEQKSMAEGIARMVAAIRIIPDDPAEDDREFYHALDSLRPHRPLFEGFY